MAENLNVQEIVSEVLEHLRGMWRYRWWAASVAWVIALIGWGYVYFMPDVYRASAEVYLETETLMDPVFKGLALRDNLEAQVAAVSRALLTRPNLEAVARATDLDLRARSSEEMERLITNLQKRISVNGNGRRSSGNTFSIDFADSDRAKATQVVAAIVDAFVENSLQGQGEDADMTERALEAELQNHERRLQESESRLADFKKENLGYMPNDRGDYYGRLQSALAAVEMLEGKMRALQQRRDELVRQVDGESPVLGDAALLGACAQQGQISDLQAQLATLQVDFTERHPRIVALKETIGFLLSKCEEEAGAIRRAGVISRPADGEPLESNPVYQNLRMLLTNTELELAGLGSELAEQQAEVRDLRANVDKIADVEKNLKMLNRDYGVIQGRYQELVARRETLESKQRLGPATEVTPFRILEPPFASSTPVGPNRPLFILAVMVVAIGIGVALAFGLNQLNPVFFTRRSVTQFAGVPVLGSVSMLLSPDANRARRLGIFAWGATYVGLLLIAGLAIAFQSPGSLLLRQLIRDLSA